MALIIISRCDFTISGLDLCVAGCEIVVSFPKICLIVGIFRFGMAADFGLGMGIVGKGALVGMVQPSGNSEGVAFS